MGFSFLIDSDLHFEDDIKSNKRWHIDQLNQIINNLSRSTQPVRAAILPGDLTDNGFNGRSVNLGCCRSGSTVKQLDNLREKYIEKLKPRIKVYMCPGNHDKGDRLYHPVMDYIKKEHGGLNYSFDMEDVHFICCGIYPNKSTRNWLQKDLEKNLDKRFVIYFHYNLEGNFSDWWSDNEKDAFYNIIKPYKSQILSICTGHLHSSYTSRWRDLLVISAAGNYIAVGSYNKGTFTVDFYGQSGFTSDKLFRKFE